MEQQKGHFHSITFVQIETILSREKLKHAGKVSLPAWKDNCWLVLLDWLHIPSVPVRRHLQSMGFRLEFGSEQWQTCNLFSVFAESLCACFQQNQESYQTMAVRAKYKEHERSAARTSVSLSVVSGIVVPWTWCFSGVWENRGSHLPVTHPHVDACLSGGFQCHIHSPNPFQSHLGFTLSAFNAPVSVAFQPTSGRFVLRPSWPTYRVRAEDVHLRRSLHTFWRKPLSYPNSFSRDPGGRHLQWWSINNRGNPVGSEAVYAEDTAAAGQSDRRALDPAWRRPNCSCASFLRGAHCHAGLFLAILLTNISPHTSVSAGSPHANLWQKSYSHHARVFTYN